MLSAVKDLNGGARKNDTWTLGSVRGNIVTKLVFHYSSKFCVFVLDILCAFSTRIDCKTLFNNARLDLLFHSKL